MLNLRILGKKINNNEIRGDGLIKKRIEMVLAEKKNLRFFEIDKLIIKCWGDFSNIFMNYYMSLKIPFRSKLIFQKTAHSRESINKYFNDLDNDFIFIGCRWYQKNNLQEPLPFGGCTCDLESFFKLVDFLFYVCY